MIVATLQKMWNHGQLGILSAKNLNIELIVVKMLK